METPKCSHRMLFRVEYIKKHYPDFYQFILDQFDNKYPYNESLYLYINHMSEPPICKTCGKPKIYRNSPAGYGKYCNRGCVDNQLKSEKTKATKLERYGNENYNNLKQIKQTNLEKYGTTCTLQSKEIKEKVKQTNIERYGAENPFASQDIKEKIKQTNLEKYGVEYSSQSQKIKEKIKQTNLEKYGSKNPMQNSQVREKQKRTMNQRYGVDYAMLSPILSQRLSESLIKTHQSGQYLKTHRANNSFNTSSIEKQFEQYLQDQQIQYIYQYTSNLYPYTCDFYIPKYDLYIEIQGTWTHGGHPYSDSQDDKEVVNKWKSKNTKFYNQAIYVWTQLDPKKRKIAQQNHLNYLEIFSIDINEVIKEFNNFIQTYE